MAEGPGALVAWILIPAFLAVGLYLLWYTRRRRRMLEAFARAHHYPQRPQREAELQRILDEAFSLQGRGRVRSFGRVASLVDGGAVWIFRTVELLDLDRYGSAGSTHFARIAALFEAPSTADAFFIVDRSGRPRPRPTGAAPPEPWLAEAVRGISGDCGARHPLSVTLAGGRGLIHFEPLVTGGESASDIDCLHCIASRLPGALSGYR